MNRGLTVTLGCVVQLQLHSTCHTCHSAFPRNLVAQSVKGALILDNASSAESAQVQQEHCIRMDDQGAHASEIVQGRLVPNGLTPPGAVVVQICGLESQHHPEELSALPQRQLIERLSSDGEQMAERESNGSPHYDPVETARRKIKGQLQ